ncbi:DUF1232 domain-containing protein [Streptomyces sp. KR80]|uniref:DUF1232 domain-containing protein n=1 Tax=Streptomyces sp. KR80 TaxID=3457426 RepID=UPI003FD2E8EC
MSTELWIVAAVATGLVVLTVVLTVRLLVKLVAARRRLRAAGIPLERKAAYWGAVLYVLCPVDLLPDPVLLDDIGVLLVALRTLHSAADRPGRGDGRRDRRRGLTSDSSVRTTKKG